MRLETKKREKIRLRLLLSLLLLIQLAFVFTFAAAKSGYHVDEISSYKLANSYYKPFLGDIDDYFDHWQTSCVYHNLITVQPGEQFAYGSVKYNQERDVHPPLYYMVLHTVGSLFPDTFSKWMGIGINFVLFVIADLLLYLLGKRLFRSRYAALLPCLFWGFSAGAVASVVFIRMYAMLTCWVLLLTYIVLAAVNRPHVSWKQVLLLFLTVFCGFMTHYYFLIYLCFLAVAAAGVLVVKKRYTDLITCVVGVAAAGLAGVLFFPKSISQFLFSYRGKEVQSGFFNLTDWHNRWVPFKAVVNHELFGGWMPVMTGLIILCFAVWLLTRFVVHVHAEYDNDKRKLIVRTAFIHENRMVFVIRAATVDVLLLLIACAGYFLIVMITAPVQADRYLYPIFPLLALLFVFALTHGLRVLTANKKIIVAVVVAFTLLASLFGIGRNPTAVMNYNRPALPAAMADEYHADAVVVDQTEKTAFNTNEIIFQLMKYRRVYPTTYAHINRLAEALNRQQQASRRPLVIYIDKNVNADEVLQRLAEKTVYTHAKKLLSFTYFYTYRLD
ncbi:MAG: glycosyltransferase family 39 protein [Sporolactobacillus sp.]|nr:glycosyltransferase family 39 protein [Sporolactobacillus sp.]